MPLESDEEVLCKEVTVGKIGRRVLSLDVSLYHRDTAEWGSGQVHCRVADFALNGVFLELGVQGVIRRDGKPLKPGAPLPRPMAYMPGMSWWGTAQWDASRMILAPGIERCDLDVLHDLANAYCNAMIVHPERRVRAVFMSRIHELQIRQICERLNNAAV